MLECRKLVQTIIDEYTREHFSYDPSTGAWESRDEIANTYVEALESVRDLYAFCGQPQSEQQEPNMTNEIPRRAYTDRMIPAEKAIRDAILAVEALPADIRLTDAVILLGKAKDKVADYVDGGN